MDSEISKLALDIPDGGLLQFWLHRGHTIYRIVEWESSGTLKCRKALDRAIRSAAMGGKTPLIVWRTFDSGEVAYILVN